MEINHPIIQLLMDIPQGVSPPTFTNQQTHHPLAPRHEKLLLPGHLEGWEDQKKYIKGRCSDQNKKHDSLFKGKIRNSENLNSNQTRVFFFKTLRRCKDLNMVTLEIRRNLSGCATRLWQPQLASIAPSSTGVLNTAHLFRKYGIVMKIFVPKVLLIRPAPKIALDSLASGICRKKEPRMRGATKLPSGKLT